jgi:hypothetical protein
MQVAGRSSYRFHFKAHVIHLFMNHEIRGMDNLLDLGLLYNAVSIAGGTTALNELGR